jgi:hypothetical protein
MGKATSRGVSLVRLSPVDLSDLCGEEKSLPLGKSRQTLTPDYMHRHARAASAEMD